MPGNLFPPSPHITEDDLAAIIYTSGTTGNPKGVELSHRNIASDIDGACQVHSFSNIEHYSSLRHVFQERIAANPNTKSKYIVNVLAHNVSLCFLPWSHVFGLTVELNAMMSTGSAMAIVPHRDMILQCLLQVKPTIIFTVPMLMNKVYDGVMKTVGSAPRAQQQLFQAAFAVARKRNHAIEYGQKVSWWTETLFQVFDRLVFAKIREKLGGSIR